MKRGGGRWGGGGGLWEKRGGSKFLQLSFLRWLPREKNASVSGSGFQARPLFMLALLSELTSSTTEGFLC